MSWLLHLMSCLVFNRLQSLAVDLKNIYLLLFLSQCRKYLFIQTQNIISFSPPATYLVIAKSYLALSFFLSLTHTHTLTHTHILIHTHTHTNTRTQGHTEVLTFTLLFTISLTHTQHTHAHTRTHAHTHTHKNTHVSKPLFLYSIVSQIYSHTVCK